MNDREGTIKEFIENGKRFLIALDPSAEEATLLASLALKKILENHDKEIFFWPPLSNTFQEKFKTIFSIRENPKIIQKIKIKIPKNIALEEIRYEEEPDALGIVISPKEPMEPDELSIEKVPYEVDTAFYFFREDEAESRKIQTPVAKPPQEKIIFLLKNSRTLSEKIHDIDETLNESLASDETVTTLLFASLIYETGHMQNAASAKTFALASALLNKGANHTAVSNIVEQEKDIARAQLFGRALARTTIDTGLKTSWTFLSRKDFEKTQLEPAEDMLVALIRKIRKFIQHQPFSILCYEASEIGTIIFGENTAILTGMAERLGREPKSLYFFGPSFPTFSEAEIKLRELLKESLSYRINT
ncbi:hypothetical protein IIA95_00145 [Patescibacteria group bacterium]|nr:hypothetical protein [Patescibacteria group bacterium]